MKNINLPRIKALQNISRHVEERHYFGIEDAIGAISNGCTYRKTFYDKQKLPADNKFALLPEDLQKVAQFRSNFQFMNIDRGLDLQNVK